MTFDNLPSGAVVVDSRERGDNDYVVLCRLPEENFCTYVTWRTHADEDGVCRSYYWGHYHDTADLAAPDFASR